MLERIARIFCLLLALAGRLLANSEQFMLLLFHARNVIAPSLIGSGPGEGFNHFQAFKEGPVSQLFLPLTKAVYRCSLVW